MPRQRRDTPQRDCFDDGYLNFLLREKESHAGNSGPFAFGQFQNVIDIGVFPLDQPAH
jgi:hypothetical protein